MTRLDAVALGTRVRLAGGEVATLVAVSPSRARVRLERRRVRAFRTQAGVPVVVRQRIERDVAPAAEVEVLG